MQIPVRIDNDGTGEVIMLELQGDLESRTETHMNDKFIGDLHFTKQGVPVLIIGHHILYGKVMELDKPLAVMRKINSTPMEVDGGQEELSGVEYRIKNVIRKKLLFKTRPKPIIVSSNTVPGNSV